MTSNHLITATFLLALVWFAHLAITWIREAEALHLAATQDEAIALTQPTLTTADLPEGMRHP